MVQNVKVKIIKIAGNKTIVGEAFYMRQHPVYKKYVKVLRKYMIHDEDNSVKVGDEIFIKSSRPISKRKVWVIDNKSEV
jgi:small subunit ribosomal protein S17